MNQFLLVAIIMTAWVTRYNDIGHMASTEWTHIGAVACPRDIKLGTWVEIGGKTYVCHDRTAKKYDGRFDIYDSRPTKDLLQWGKRKMEVRIIES